MLMAFLKREQVHIFCFGGSGGLWFGAFIPLGEAKQAKLPLFSSIGQASMAFSFRFKLWIHIPRHFCISLLVFFESSEVALYGWVSLWDVKRIITPIQVRYLRGRVPGCA